MIPTQPLPYRRKLLDKMENLKSFNVDLSGNNNPSISESSFQGYYSSDVELNELTSTFEELTIDVKGMVKDLFKGSKRDTDSIRQDFIRNGIDSALMTQIHNTSRQPPPGFGISKWPLANLENRSPIAKHSSLHEKLDVQADTSERSEIKSVRRKRSPKENEDVSVVN